MARSQPTPAVDPGQRIRVLQFAWQLSAGGDTPGLIRTLLASADHDRFDLHLCTARPLFPEDEVAAISPDLTMHTLGLEGRASSIDRVRAEAAFARIAGACRPDVVHAHRGLAAYTFAWKATAGRRTRAILEVHDAPGSGRAGAVAEAVEALMIRRLGYRAIAHSANVADTLSGRCRIRPGRVARIPLGIDIPTFSRAAGTGAGERWRSLHGIAPDAPVVVYVARLVPTKRADLFVAVASEVAKAIPDAVFVLAGGGDQASASAQVATLRAPVLVTGFEADLPALYAAADVFLSTSDYEGFGLALAEAMAAGLPVVATDVGGVRDVVDDGVTGRIVAAGDRAALSAAVAAILALPDRGRVMGERGQRRAQLRFDRASMVSAYEACWQAAAERRW